MSSQSELPQNSEQSKSKSVVSSAAGLSPSDMNIAAKDAAKFLKSTLRLPSTTFPPRPPPADLARYLPTCTDDLYSWQRRERPASNPFTLHDGPPYANGDLHVGHALNKILKDIICRSNLAEGKRVDYVPGWDCHGLPIELKALEQHGWKRGQDVDAVSIRSAAKAFARDTIAKQMEGFKSWAVMGDWDSHWETMDKDFEIRQLNIFKAMADHGLIYRKHKPVFWSPSSRTALAEAELEYKDDHISTAAYVKFPLKGAGFTSDPVHALIWTTTPWTLPANQAIALNPSLQYCLVKSEEHGLLVLARSRLELLQDVLGNDTTVVNEHLPVEDLLSCTYDGLAQFGPQALDRPVVFADFVTAESGTGLVHCAPGHGMEDYQALHHLMQEGRVEARAPVDDSGLFDATASPQNPGLLGGQGVFTTGNETVLALLDRAGMLLHKHRYGHKYPIDWRTKEPVIIRATAQWFADLSNIREDTLQAIERVVFTPASGKNRLRSFVENRTEWCISRQRSWGVPIPAIYHHETGEAVLSAKTVGHIIDVIQQRGIDAWWSDSANEPAWIPAGLDASQYRRGTDTMDVWFDSGSSWTHMLKDGNSAAHPQADIYIEGTDQHRGWFQSSLLTKVAYQRSMDPSTVTNAPFKALVTHGFTLDAHGKKMSKSLGNVISPDQIVVGIGPALPAAQPKSSKKQREVHPLGPDALRLWVASSDWTRDVTISDTVIKTVHTALDKYRVTIKLLLGLLKNFDPRTALPYNKLSMLDQIALVQLHGVWTTARRAYTDLEFHRAVTTINRWVVADLSGFYFEAVKDICYCDSPTAQRRLSTCTVLHHILSYLQNMLGPVLPLLVEESWAHSPEVYKVALQHPLRRIWETAPVEWCNTELQDVLPIVMSVNSGVKAAQEKARSEKLLGQSLASEVKLYLEPGVGIGHIPVNTWMEALVVSNVTVLEEDDFDKRAATEVANPTSYSWVRSSDISNSAGQRIGVAVVNSPTKEKCRRCWRYLAEPVEEETIPLCVRCTATIEEFR